MDMWDDVLRMNPSSMREIETSRCLEKLDADMMGW
jgi:hypothetical protein